MISRKKIILIYLSFPFVHEGCKQEPNEIPKEFVERKISTNRGGESNLELFYEDGFRVNIEKNKLVVQTVQENHKCMLEIPNGSLEGIDGGEWGGELSFVPNGVNTKRIKIKAGNIKSIFSFKNKVYFIQGLHHMGYSEGALYELVVKDSIFTYVDKLKFEDSPEAIYILDDKFLIAGSKNFYVVKDFNAEVIFENPFWSKLYPNSIAATDVRNVYVGLRGGIVKLDLTKGTFLFYRYEG